MLEAHGVGGQKLFSPWGSQPLWPSGAQSLLPLTLDTPTPKFLLCRSWPTSADRRSRWETCALLPTTPGQQLCYSSQLLGVLKEQEVWAPLKVCSLLAFVFTSFFRLTWRRGIRNLSHFDGLSLFLVTEGFESPHEICGVFYMITLVLGHFTWSHWSEIHSSSSLTEAKSSPWRLWR